MLDGRRRARRVDGHPAHGIARPARGLVTVVGRGRLPVVRVPVGHPIRLPSAAGSRNRERLASPQAACEGGAVAFITTVSPRRATGEAAAAYRYMAEVGGSDFVANVVRLFSVRPASMRRMIRSWELTMWVGDEPRTLRETVASAVSRLNDCHY
jgi:hypothetical protein